MSALQEFRGYSRAAFPIIDATALVSGVRQSTIALCFAATRSVISAALDHADELIYGYFPTAQHTSVNSNFAPKPLPSLPCSNFSSDP